MLEAIPCFGKWSILYLLTDWYLGIYLYSKRTSSLRARFRLPCTVIQQFKTERHESSMYLQVKFSQSLIMMIAVFVLFHRYLRYPPKTTLVKTGNVLIMKTRVKQRVVKVLRKLVKPPFIFLKTVRSIEHTQTSSIINRNNLETFDKHEMKIDSPNLRVNFAIE